MIKIRNMKKYTLISSNVTDFAESVGYCEHKIPFFLQGIETVPTLATIKGTASHEEEEEIEKEQFEFVPITVEELNNMKRNVEFARENIYTRLLLPLRIRKTNVVMLLFGRADKVFRKNKTLVIQEDKFPYNITKYENIHEPFDDQKLQALTYLNSKFTDDPSAKPDEWFGIPHKEKAWIIQIRDRNNYNKPFKIFKGTQNKNATKFLVENMKRFALLTLGFEEPLHHNQPAKCKPCSFYTDCKHRLD